MREEIELIRPDRKYAQQVMDFQKELFMIHDKDPFAGCAGLEDCSSFEEWLDFAGRLSKKYGKEYVPSETFLALRKEDDRIIGIIDYRHPLSEQLKKYAGNIGYSVLPSERRKGYAKRMLELMFEICREYGEKRVLICCDKDNEASRSTIMSCGGVLENEVPDELGIMYSGIIQRFWIEI